MARSAEYNLGEYAFPRGWFVVANGADITEKPTNAHYFGEDVVIFRGQSGKVVMLEAYCPHMGTHLGTSTGSHVVKSGMHVEGNNIRCPFHGWRFGADGKCNHIPYFDGPIPKAARLKSWPVTERYGIVFCWNDPEGQAPDFDIPAYDVWDDPEFIRWEGVDHLGDLGCHPIEIFDNNSDYAHLLFLHGADVQWYENEIDGHIYHQRESQFGQREESGPMIARFNGVCEEEAAQVKHAPMTTLTSYNGPGIAQSHFYEAEVWQLIAATPIDDGSARLWQASMKRAPGGVIDEAAREQARSFNAMMCQGLGVHDGQIWATKRAATKVMQLPTDGPFGQARIWYSQFFNPRDRAGQILKHVSGLHYVKGVPGAPVREAAE